MTGVRQSTAFQAVNNAESRRRQYGLVERASSAGATFRSPMMILVAQPAAWHRQGLRNCWPRSANAALVRCYRSRIQLARNGRGWHTLLEFCRLVGTLIVDEDSVYDPRSINDRLLLGMKGTISEMEVSVFRQRSIEPMTQKGHRAT